MVGKCVLVASSGLFGAIFGLFVGLAGFVPTLPPVRHPGLATYPLPYHVPKYRHGVSLRLAMVHDVLHERFPRHGRTYYEYRNRKVREEITGLKDAVRDDGVARAKRFRLLDDLGAGLDFVGEHDEAVRVLRDKLTEQQAEGLSGRELYTSYANLGTFLIHGNAPRAIRGDPVAKGRVREGLDLIHKAIEVNPQAHFGREAWQAITVEFLLAAIDDPQLLSRFDLVGNRLDKTIDPQLQLGYKSPEWVPRGEARMAAFYLAHPESTERAEGFRNYITLIGAEEGWVAVPTSHTKPVPFDEPVLGIIGMWRLGGGANPHFALALGETMLRVGQRYIAWCAYERAALMEDRFWPDPEICRAFVAHCRQRQALLEKDMPEDDRAALRPRFSAELEFGRQFQQAYQNYEAERLANGTSFDDPHFYDAFHAQHAPIASPPGSADKLLVQVDQHNFQVSLPSVLLFAGLFAFACAQCLRWRGRRARLSSLAISAKLSSSEET
jgi:hypothetical protein